MNVNVKQRINRRGEEDSDCKGEETGDAVATIAYKDFFNTSFTSNDHGSREDVIASSSNYNGCTIESAPKGPYASSSSSSKASCVNVNNVSLDLTLG
ncbi:hypothetical protein L6452_19578 [Arctium lappa]|uniref:Uncharacterized protein n=1 Tax=Arctium lappa TaxID=4217 RepID=A0ACB9B8F8_ARCLA|nr:hypothetical protein L6452_19578 [Arctium lappa]